MSYGVFNTCKKAKEMTTAQRWGVNGSILHYEVLMLNFMQYYLKVHSKIYTTNPQVTTEVTEQRGIANKPLRR